MRIKIIIIFLLISVLYTSALMATVINLKESNPAKRELNLLKRISKIK